VSVKIIASNETFYRLYKLFIEEIALVPLNSFIKVKLFPYHSIIALDKMILVSKTY
jgi:hypothetical protein